MTKDEDFVLSLPQYVLSGQARALKYGEHGLGLRPVYVGPVVFIMTIAHQGSHLALGSTASANLTATGRLL